MATTTLNDLPGELICLILQQVGSGKDLYAFLRASSKIYGAFSTSKDSILWKISRHSMVPEVLVDAITAVKLRNMECDFREVCSKYYEISALAREKLLTEDDNRSWPKDWITGADLSALTQLQSAVEYFVDEFCSQSLPTLFKHPSHPVRDLSIIERSRLQRAFFRYDICRTLMYYPGRFRDDLVELLTLVVDLVMLLHHLKLWEVEEIACIWQYMRKRLGDVFDILGEKVLDSVVSNPGQGKVAQDSLPANSSGVPIAAVLVSRFNEGQDDFIFSEAGKGFQYRHITFLAGRPLPFLQTLFESGADTQRRLVFKYEGFENVDLGQILRENCILRRIFPSNDRWLHSGQPTEFEGDKLDNRNLAWQWASNLMAECHQYCLPGDFDLRTGGYVFWDEDRLERGGITQGRPPFVNEAVLPPVRNHMEEPSVEQRLKDMKLPDGWDLVLVKEDW
jgi:hypothetical protein